MWVLVRKPYTNPPALCEYNTVICSIGRLNVVLGFSMSWKFWFGEERKNVSIFSHTSLLGFSLRAQILMCEVVVLCYQQGVTTAHNNI